MGAMPHENHCPSGRGSLLPIHQGLLSKQSLEALEDNFPGKLLGLNMYLNPCIKSVGSAIYIQITPVEELTRATLCAAYVPMFGMKRSFGPDNIFTKEWPMQ